MVVLRSNINFKESLPILTIDPTTGKPVSVGKKSIAIMKDEIKRCSEDLANRLIAEYNVAPGTRAKNEDVCFEIIKHDNPESLPVMDFIEQLNMQPYATLAGKPSGTGEIAVLQGQLASLMGVVENLTGKISELEMSKKAENKQLSTEKYDKKANSPTPNRQIDTGKKSKK